MKPPDHTLRALARVVHDQAGALPLTEILRHTGEIALEPGTRLRLLPASDTAPAIVVIERAYTPPEWLGRLTPRQRQVARLVAAGHSNKRIAGALGISVATVKDHVHGVLSRSGLRRRAEVAARLRHVQPGT